MALRRQVLSEKQGTSAQSAFLGIPSSGAPTELRLPSSNSIPYPRWPLKVPKIPYELEPRPSIRMGESRVTFFPSMLVTTEPSWSWMTLMLASVRMALGRPGAAMACPFRGIQRTGRGLERYAVWSATGGATPASPPPGPIGVPPSGVDPPAPPAPPVPPVPEVPPTPPAPATPPEPPPPAPPL